jgi:MAF protein
MRKIYLASASKARKQLLKTFGLKFRTFPSRVKEKIHPGKLSYAGLVKSNALAKAKDVAGRIKSGVVIGADTIVVQENKIFGKPKNIKDAKKMLKRLSRKPQWLYTGLAVVDKDNGRALVSCEKTKIYMDALTGPEIDRYFSKVSPLDKAGSFDIQGKGAFFIRRIEGCFYNIVGLPMRSLYQMFRKLGLKVFMILLVTLCIGEMVTVLSGCSSEYNIVTGEEESYYYSTDKEVQMGKAIVKEAEKEYKLAQDPLLQERVKSVGKKIAAVCDRKEINYEFKVLDEEEVNAVSLPGGFVYVNKGLLEKISTDDELAGVLAHEVGHIVARHSMKKLQGYQGYSILRVLLAVSPVGGEVGAAADTAFAELLMGYSREDELLADKLGARYAKLAGYDPHGMINFLLKLQDINRRKPLEPRSYYKTHPYVPDRIRVVKQELNEGIGFDDYINIEQGEHK